MIFLYFFLAFWAIVGTSNIPDSTEDMSDEDIITTILLAGPIVWIVSILYFFCNALAKLIVYIHKSLRRESSPKSKEKTDKS